MIENKKSKNGTTPLHNACKNLLISEWDEVMAIPNVATLRDQDWGAKFERLITAGGSTYPYVLLGQVLGKATNGELNALCLQDSSSLPGSWDARMMVKRVVVPWNNAIGKPFPGSNLDPYVNNPARYKNFGPEMASKAGNRALYALLEEVMQYLQEHGQSEARRLLRLILIETRHSLESNKRDYFGPARASLDDVMRVLRDFLEERSNGVRLQVVCYAVFKAISNEFKDFGEVRSYSTNSSDMSGERVGDVERLVNGKVHLAVEVKDRMLSFSDVESTILKARVVGVRNLMFLVQAKPLLENEEEILSRVAHEFTRGTDVNISEAMSFFRSALILISAEQRANLLKVVHDALHELGAHYKHVHRWMDLMRTI